MSQQFLVTLSDSGTTFLELEPDNGPTSELIQLYANSITIIRSTVLLAEPASGGGWTVPDEVIGASRQFLLKLGRTLDNQTKSTVS